MNTESTNLVERATIPERTICSERATVDERTNAPERPEWLNRYLNKQATSGRNRHLLKLNQAVSQLKSLCKRQSQ